MRYLINILRCSSMASALMLCGCIGDNRYAAPNPLAGQAPPEPPPAGAPFIAVTNEYTHLGLNTQNAQYTDSARFRVYSNNSIDQNVLSYENTEDILLGLEYLESAYTYFVDDVGFRSPSLSVYSNDGPYYKMNVYSTKIEGDGAAGKFFSDAGAGLGFIQTQRGGKFVYDSRGIKNLQLLVHEFGHALTYSEYNWASQSSTNGWMETVAEWVTDAYLTSPAYQQLMEKLGLGREEINRIPSNILELSYLTIVHKENEYMAWPFLTYLTHNPDGIARLGKSIVPDLHRQHRHNNETPLHVLQRIIAPVTVQYVLGRYWARMAYLDINHSSFSFPPRRHASTNFIDRAYANWQALGGNRYQVIPYKKPMYGGANINPLTVLNGTVEVQVVAADNTATGFIATLSVYDAATEQTRYIPLIEGYATATLTTTEEASLVVVNNPTKLLYYDADYSTLQSPEQVGLDYTVTLLGAEPKYIH